MHVFNVVFSKSREDTASPEQCARPGSALGPGPGGRLRPEGSRGLCGVQGPLRTRAEAGPRARSPLPVLPCSSSSALGRTFPRLCSLGAGAMTSPFVRPEAAGAPHPGAARRAFQPDSHDTNGW